MSRIALLLLFTALASPPASAELVAIRVGRAETVAQGPLENAVVLVEGGRIVAVGADLPVARGIRVLDRRDWVVTPGLVNSYSRLGMDGQAGKLDEPETHASEELYPRQEEYRDVLELGVTTIALYPPGTGLPGQAVAVRPAGDTPRAMTIEEGVYLKITMASSAQAKKDLRGAFEKVDEYEEKVRRAREKWEKEQERKRRSKATSKKDDDERASEDTERKDEREAEDRDASGDRFVPPDPEPYVVAMQRVRSKELPVLFAISKASDYLHLLEALGREDVDWFLRLPLRSESDFHFVEEQIGEQRPLVVIDPELTLMQNSRRERNLPAELARAGARIVLVPARDTVQAHRTWMADVGRLVATGLDRSAALAAVTSEAAAVLGLDERLGTLSPGKDANMVFWSGDPFEPQSLVEAVMLEGELVYERSKR